MKVKAHTKVYKFDQGAMVIRVLDQWLIKLKLGTVNKLTITRVGLGFLGF
jgi:hypothetical protein